MRWALLILFLLAAARPGAVAANEATPEAALERLFSTRPLSEEQFAPDFLNRVPASQIEAGIAELTVRYGPLQQVTRSRGKLRVLLERAEIPVRVTLDARGRIAGLFFEPVVPTTGGLDEHLAAIAALPGRTSVLVTAKSTTRAAHDPEAVLAVGSAGKLAVLKATVDAVTAGGLKWDQVVTLDPAWRSLPGGVLQDWPPGTPLTIATLANLAVSIGDNTATDALIHLLGRNAVQAVAPVNMPFLTTREMFTLKSAGNAELRERWHKADGAGRTAMLAELAALPLPIPADLATTPTLAAEWHLSASEICRLLRATHELPALQVNVGPADVGNWRTLAYKGGSAPGVLNLSSRFTARDGTTYCVVATWNNDAALEEERLITSYRAILRLLAGRAE